MQSSALSWASKLGTAAEHSRALAQALRLACRRRLPVKMGGLGLIRQSSIIPSACVGTWALIWRPMQQLCPQLWGPLEGRNDRSVGPKMCWKGYRSRLGGRKV